MSAGNRSDGSRPDKTSLVADVRARTHRWIRRAGAASARISAARRAGVRRSAPQLVRFEGRYLLLTSDRPVSEAEARNANRKAVEDACADINGVAFRSSGENGLVRLDVPEELWVSVLEKILMKLGGAGFVAPDRRSRSTSRAWTTADGGTPASLTDRDQLVVGRWWRRPDGRVAGPQAGVELMRWKGVAGSFYRSPADRELQVEVADLNAGPGVPARTEGESAPLPLDVSGAVPIDLVVLWTDRTDPTWQERQRVPADTAPLPRPSGGTSPQDADDLLMTLRSVEQHLPWVRRVHLVTDDQVPAWISTDCPPHLIAYTDLTDAEMTTERGIVARLHLIDDLSDQFLLLDAGTVFLRPVRPGSLARPGCVAVLPVHRTAIQPADSDRGPSALSSAGVLEASLGLRAWRRPRRPLVLNRQDLSQCAALDPGQPVVDSAENGQPADAPADVAEVAHAFAFLRGATFPGTRQIIRPSLLTQPDIDQACFAIADESTDVLVLPLDRSPEAHGLVMDALDRRLPTSSRWEDPSILLTAGPDPAEEPGRAEPRPANPTDSTPRAMFMPVFPVDLVILWVDGADLAWQHRMRRALAEQTPEQVGTPSVQASRYRDNGELRYVLRSVEKYVPWVRTVHLVTDDQCPDWLNVDHPQLNLVSHRDLFAGTGVEHSFNSHAIAARLHHIAGLSDEYLVTNDDVFFARPLRPDAFFFANRLSRFFVSRSTLPPPEERRFAHEWARGHSTDLVAEHFGVRPTQNFKHVPLAMHRPLLFELESRFPAEFAETARSRFRSNSDLEITWLHNNWAFLTGQAVPAQLPYGYIQASAKPASWASMAKELNRGVFAVFCLNDDDVATHPQTLRMAAWLRSFFPERSSFEIQPSRSADGHRSISTVTPRSAEASSAPATTSV